MEAAHITWRPLGELIVERGLISEEELEDALLEQHITHKRLGTILIDKGVVSAQQLTDALVDQIGVEELLDEFDRTEATPGGRRSERLFAPLRRLRRRLRNVEPPPASTVLAPFAHVVARVARIGRRGRDASTRLVADRSFALPRFRTAEPARQLELQPRPEPDAATDAGPAVLVAAQELPELEPEAHEPEEPQLEEPQPEESQPEESQPEESQPAQPQAEEPDPAQATDPALPHAWLATARGALDQAEQDIVQLEGTAVARGLELKGVRAELADREAALAHESTAHRQAEEEIERLVSLIDERDAGLTAIEATVDELRRQRAATENELAGLRTEFDRTSSALQVAQREVSERSARIAELESTLKDYDQRGLRIGELEAQAADLAESLSATDETLGIEMHAREQAQREAKRLQDELDDRDARVAKLARQLEAVEAELQVVVAEREQSQRKLRSRERRVEKLEASLAEVRADQAQAAEAQAEEAEPMPSEPVAENADEAPQTEAEAEAETVETVETVEIEPPAEPEVADEPSEQLAGFLYFVPRPGEGYELVEVEGDAPAIGERVEHEAQRFDVTRHSRSPLPFDRRVCVYLRLAD